MTAFLVAVSFAACENNNSQAVSSQMSSGENSDGENINDENSDTITMNILVNGYTLSAKLSANSSAKALVDLLKQGNLILQLHDYGNFEKVGSLGTSLPRNDSQITTSAGDLILYQGNQFSIYYDVNSWSFTRLGKIENVSSSELKKILGTGDVSVELSLSE